MIWSPEYPDLPWMPPKSWTNANRTSVQLIVIHDTENSEGPTAAEAGASYDQRRTDGTSTHYFHDSDSTVQCVRTEDIAHAARRQGNLRGIQHELCGREGQGAAGWADPVSQGTLRQAAFQCARDARKWNIPVRHLTVAQVAAGEKGFCGHGDVTLAFPQDGGDHTDPGKDFPWTQFLTMVRAELAPTTNPGDDMPTAQEIVDELMKRHVIGGGTDYGTFGGVQATLMARTNLIANTQLPGLSLAVSADNLDEVEVAASVLAGLTPQLLGAAILSSGLTPQAIADALPDDLASRLVDTLAQRLGRPVQG